jgi:signal transduction histidine kinase
MDFPQQSIRQKVVGGYVVGFMLMLAVIGVNAQNLRHVEEMVISGEKVSDLFDTALEIRRFEKNYFLYEKEHDYLELMTYVNKAETILTNHEKTFALYAKPEVISTIRADLDEYRVMLKTLPVVSNKNSLEKRLRSAGRSIVTSSERISTTERQVMQATLQSAQNTMIISIIFIVSAGFIVGALFYGMFIRPLRLLEKHMDRVARGEFSPVRIVSRDREMVSLGRAFNRMIHELEERKMYLVQSEKLASLGTLLFGVAHELNNPLSNISTSCQILKEEIGEADLAYKIELLSQMEGETERAKEIVGCLREYSRRGKMETVNLKDAVSETIRFIRGEVPTKISIDVNIPEGLTVFADKQRIQQAFLNLIKNSMDSISGEGRISISARMNSLKSMVEVVFADTGAGMDKDMLSKIFNPFFSTKGAEKGYGLGLFIVHNIIQEHGGQIIVDSEPDYGTTFMIELPPKELK